ncbi:MAG: efflux RND transporter permease subunit, partial [Calditrichaeota bacterium]|nr:efflux RND transporter permease subunit [Calditrichota bacterium]
MALKRNVTVLMSLIAICVIGFIALTQIKLEFMPKGLNAPFLGAWVPYPNSTPEEVETIIAKKVEGALSSLPQKEQISANISENGVWVFVRFDAGADIDRAYMDMVDRMERIKAELPDESQNFRVRRWRGGGDDDIELFVLTKKNTGYEFNFVKNFVVKRLERIDGVANIDFDAAGEKSIYIYVNSDLVKAYKVDLPTVIQRIRQENFMMSSGYVHEGNHKIYVRSKAKVYSLDRLRNLVINDKGLKLADIAEVDFSEGERQWAWRINGSSGMDIELQKEPMANTIEVTDRIVAEVDEMNKLPQMKEAGVELQVIFNKGKYIKQSVFNLLEAGLWGGLFAFVFIYMFIKRFRMTSIITMAIPASILISILCIYFLDMTLNGMTMMGLLIAVGLVVDNAIVIVENIYHKRQEGMELNESAIQGTSEVGLAITLSTLTTIAIFMPIILMPTNGMTGFFKAIAIPIIGAMVASLIVAVVYIPYTSTRITSKKKIMVPNWTRVISRKLADLTMFFVRRRVDAFVVFLILMMYLMMAPGPQQLGMNANGNVNNFRFMIDMPDNYTFEQGNQFLKELEAKLDKKREEYDLFAYSAYTHKSFIHLNVFLQPKVIPPWYTSVYRNIRSGLTEIGFPKQDLPITREEAEADFRKEIPDVPGMKIRTSWNDNSFMKSDPSVSLQVEGDDTKKLLEIAHEMERRLQTIPVVTSTDVNLENGQDEVQVHLDRTKLKKYDLDPSAVRNVIDFNIRGVRFNNFQNKDGEEVQVIVQARREDRERLEQLKNISVINRQGMLIPLSNVASFDVATGLGSIRHLNGKTVIELKAKTDSEEKVAQIYENLPRVMAGLEMPFGYKYGLGQIARQTQEQQNDMMMNVFIGIILILLLMGVLFESFILPFSVIVSVPLAFIGSKIMLLITGTGADLMANIGYIILVGIVVNNGIVLIDAVNRYRKQGMSRN